MLLFTRLLIPATEFLVNTTQRPMQVRFNSGNRSRSPESRLANSRNVEREKKYGENQRMKTDKYDDRRKEKKKIKQISILQKL